MNPQHAANSPPAVPSVPSIAPPGRRRRKARQSVGLSLKPVKRPELSSIMHRMQQQSDLSLFVHPIMWTDIHSDLLRIQFLEQAPSPVDALATKAASFSKCCHPSSVDARNPLDEDLMTLLLEPKGSLWEGAVVQSMLKAMFPGTLDRAEQSADLDLRFGGQPRCKTRVHLLWNHLSPNAHSMFSFASETTLPADSFGSLPAHSSVDAAPRQPRMAYISRTYVDALRRSAVRVSDGPDGSMNTPVLRLRYLRGKQMLPANPDHDAHIAGILLILAQEHFYQREDPAVPDPLAPMLSRPRAVPDFRDTTVYVLTGDRLNSEFVVYKTVVTAPFLLQFHLPFKSFSDPPGTSNPPTMTVYHSKVSFRPLDTLAARLGLALGDDVVGQLKREEIDVIPEKTTGVPYGHKRRRSFDQYFDQDSLSLRAVPHSFPQSLKRRCVIGKHCPLDSV